jgi:hypothetical protein
MFAAHQDQRLLVPLEDAAKNEGLRHIGTPANIEQAKPKVKAWEAILRPDVVASVRRHWSGGTLESVSDEQEWLRHTS